jgi:hypothetical protein
LKVCPHESREALDQDQGQSILEFIFYFQKFVRLIGKIAPIHYKYEDKPLADVVKGDNISLDRSPDP